LSTFQDAFQPSAPIPTSFLYEGSETKKRKLSSFKIFKNNKISLKKNWKK
jgi:hypothetical protein